MNESEIRMEGREPDEFEQQLMQALHRVNAPAGLAARIMECVAECAIPNEKILPMRPWFANLRVRVLAGGAIAATLALGVFLADQVHVRHEREQVALAQQQFETAMRVTDHALDQMRTQLQRAGLTLVN